MAEVSLLGFRGAGIFTSHQNAQHRRMYGCNVRAYLLFERTYLHSYEAVEIGSSGRTKYLIFVESERAG